MPVKRGTTEQEQAARRATPSSREHELAMAIATKQTRATSATTEVGTATTGALAGQVYLKSHVTVRDDGEDWPKYIGRYEAELRDLLSVNARLNVELHVPAPAAEKGAK